VSGSLLAIESLAERLGVAAALLRLRGALRRRLSRRYRAHEAAIQGDYESCQEAFRQVSRGAPPGDPGRPALFICSLTTVFGRKLEGVLSLAARLAGLAPQFVELGHDPWGARYHSLFGTAPHPNFRWFRARVRATPSTGEIRDFARSGPTVPDLLRLSYRRVDIGRIALSNVLNRHKFRRFDLQEPRTLREVEGELLQVQWNVHTAEEMLDRLRPEMLLLLEKGLSPAAELVGAALARGTPVVQYVGSQRTGCYVLKRFRYEGRHQHPFSLSAESWSRARSMPWGPDRDARLMRDLTESYASGTWFDRKYLHQGKRIKPPERVREQLGLDPSRKTAAVFSHVLWDATFFYGEGLFDDYETWLLETLKAACANERLNWVVKLHPDLVWKLRHEGHSGELRDLVAMRGAVGALPGHVKLVLPDTDISTYSFFGITDYCVTVRGTVGIEMACHGVPVVTAGTGRYSGLGFTVDSSSTEEYLAKLAALENEPPLGPQRTELARRFAYTLFTLRPWHLRSFETTKLGVEDVTHPLAANLVPRVASFQELAAADETVRLVAWLGTGESDYLEGPAVRGT
jgi:hypothetical protein